MTDSKRSTKEKVFMAIGIIVLVSLILLGTFALPVGFSLCGAIGLVYGVAKKDKAFIRWSSLALLIGAAMVAYTVHLINSM